MRRKIHEKGGMRGTVIVRSHPAGTLHLYKTLVELGRLELARELLKGGTVEVVQKNMIVWSANCGYDILVQFLLSAYNGSFAFASTLGISWGEIGTGVTAPTNADVALTTPVARATVSYAADSGFSTAQLQFFFPDVTLPNQTYTEFGTFIGGTSTIGTGNMFNHALFTNPYSKSSGTDTTVEVDFAFGADSGFDDSGFS
jgi:hypothetical protein